LISIYIPKIQKWLKPLDIEHVIRKTTKAPRKQITGH